MSQGEFNKKRKMNNTLRHALSVADEGVVKGIGKEFIKALDQTQNITKSDISFNDLRRSS
jgi:hypothetical protein